MNPHYFFIIPILTFQVATASPRPTVNITEAAGKMVTLHLNIRKGSQQQGTYFSWIFEGKTAIAMTMGPNLNVLGSHFSGRLTLPDQTYSLQIDSLTMKDGGLYTVHVNNNSGSYILQEYRLFVYNISASANVWANKTCSLVLNCMAAMGTANVWYTWTDEKQQIITESPDLHLTLDPSQKDKTYTCTYQNSIIKQSQSIQPYKTSCGDISGTVVQAQLMSNCIMKAILTVTLVALLVPAVTGIYF